MSKENYRQDLIAQIAAGMANDVQIQSVEIAAEVVVAFADAIISKTEAAE